MNRKNQEGYLDPTACEGIQNAQRSTKKDADKIIEHKLNNLIGALKLIAECAGFEFIGRIQVRHKESGKEFR